MRVSCPISWMRKHWSFSFKFSNWRNRVKHRNVPLSVCRPIEDVRLWIENFENTELCGTAVPYHSLYSAFLFPFLNRDGISIGGGKDSLIPWFSFLFLHDLFWFYLIPRLSFNPIQTVAPATGTAVANGLGAREWGRNTGGQRWLCGNQQERTRSILHFSHEKRLSFFYS